MNEQPREVQMLIRECLNDGWSLRGTAVWAGVSKNTVQRYKKLLAAGYDVDMETRHHLPVLHGGPISEEGFAHLVSLGASYRWAYRTRYVLRGYRQMRHGALTLLRVGNDRERELAQLLLDQMRDDSTMRIKHDAALEDWMTPGRYADAG